MCLYAYLETNAYKGLVFTKIYLEIFEILSGKPRNVKEI